VMNPVLYRDLFFSSTLLNSNREAAAGLSGLLKHDPEKAYKMAKFRMSTSKGELDIAITEVLIDKGSIEDLNICKRFLTDRKKFFKTRFTPVYFRLLSQIGKVPLVR